MLLKSKGNNKNRKNVDFIFKWLDNVTEVSFDAQAKYLFIILNFLAL